MKKIIIISLCFMILLCGCNNDAKEEVYEAKLGEIQNISKSELELPEFIVDLEGKIDDALTTTDLKNITVYDFITDVTAYDIDPDSDIYHEKWTGVKLKDVLKEKGITDYDAIDFKSTGNVTVRYKKDEINDNLYLIFYRNDTLLSESEDTPIMLFASDLKNRYWVPSLTRMDIM